MDRAGQCSISRTSIAKSFARSSLRSRVSSCTRGSGESDVWLDARRGSVEGDGSGRAVGSSLQAQWWVCMSRGTGLSWVGESMGKLVGA